ncbi:MAG: DUF1987 domain-containing protein [Bacteroidales bacterium]|nr:DUF1987 domain-containing protein [Bacteroidales bacterium]
MSTFEIEATNSTPSVTYKNDGKLIIKGRSFPENVDEFYKAVFDLLEEINTRVMIVDIDLEYINSASSKKILYLLKTLDKNPQITDLTVIWRYEEDDEDILESGQIYEEFLMKARFQYSEHKQAA